MRARLPEIEAAALARINAVADFGVVVDPEYVEGVRAAVAAAVDYGLGALETDDPRALQVPLVLLAQSRLAARNGVSLDTVLRRYFAGYSLLSDFIMQEVESNPNLRDVPVHRLLTTQATHFDRLVAAVSEEYTRAREEWLRSPEQRRAERIDKLLAGEAIDTAEFSYRFDDVHLGAVAVGTGAADALRDLAAALDRQLLLVPRGEGSVWGWLGGRREVEPDEVDRLLAAVDLGQTALAVGEPGCGISGWRLTHQQARAALPIALRGPQAAVRYAAVSLLASVLQDDVLVGSLRQLYLAPLGGERDGGAVLTETLRAYFAAGRNVSSAASALGVSRQTIGNRLRAVEERLDRNLDACAVEMELALRLDDLSSHPATISPAGFSLSSALIR